MKQRQLEILLQKVPKPTIPIPQLEQYMTTAPIAADIIFTAYQWGDVENKTVVDLGCGTGIFSVGVAHMGAKKVLGFDIDKNVIAAAKKYAKANALPIRYALRNITAVHTTCDTVIMNPPFGAQKSITKQTENSLKKHLKSQVLFIRFISKKPSFFWKK